MKRLSMSKEQREHLLEMCRNLFDEFHNIKYGKHWEYDNLWMDSIPSTNPDPVEIHWFELCLRYIPQRMQEKFNVDNNAYFDLDILDDLNSDNIHPIDTLYEEYKKLKNERT